MIQMSCLKKSHMVLIKSGEVNSLFFAKSGLSLSRSALGKTANEWILSVLEF